MSDRLKDLGFGAIRGGKGDPAGAIRTAGPYAPYLSQLAQRFPDVVSRLQSDGPEASHVHALETIRAAGDLTGAYDEAMRVMRNAKAASHLAVAAADLSRVWMLDDVVGALSTLADTAVESALRLAIRSAWATGRFGVKADRDDLPGLFVLAMGKMGAGELNYSSDIDLIVLFDLDTTPVEGARVKEAMVRLTKDLVRLLDERTVDGYVFRTDLRLRPDPGSTAVAVSTQFATSYYESVGQNWERMAHIKARVCAGDREAGAAYLKSLEPYVWRRHLDYWAIGDIHSIKRQIHTHGGHAALGDPDFDIKLGRGGVREIEFFTQVQQLILGGRHPALRASGTKAALAQMARDGVIDRDVGDNLTVAYDFLRSIEHRVQMVNDEQTHRLPDIPDKRTQIASLAGYQVQAQFEADLSNVRGEVHGAYSDLFATEERLSGEAGNLVFTGVDDDPGTVATLKGLGFSDPSRVIATFQAWHRGGVAATRSPRGRQLLTSLGPRLLKMMSETGEADAAFERFRDFFSSLSAGVQTLSLMLAEPALTRDLLETMAFAPRLAADLARRPVLLDAMLDSHFRAPVSGDEQGARESRLRRLLRRSSEFEDTLNIARRFHREESFRISYQLLRGTIGADDAGAAFADLADACVSALADAAEIEVSEKFEGAVGRWSICALGKFGGRELSASSDLDLMLVYERDEGATDGNLATRFVQRLVAALSAPTEEGALYEVDMQLRPSGRSGPIAVQFSSFQSYYRGEAWTWEFMALTRLRPIAGDPDLARRIVQSAREALRHKSADPVITSDIGDMRRRMARERPAKSNWDLKLAAGGLVDIEFVIQHEILKAAGDHPEVVLPTSMKALDALEAIGRFEASEASILREGLSLQLDLQQALRIAAGDGFNPDTASAGLKRWLARHVGMADFPALEARLTRRQSEVAALRRLKLGPLTTDDAH
ncbi:MAG: bifunctional [glutamine synthetase] adenylyltransferase/[glutamine synthetase]-adenylyl-L-tyrosine phosphorylase [Alphaproteobacteria bacterium]|nr:bifunctional [glutamine synthetase] adenylyltransferase/[glutamine synthetase]-adenylyl-L-tyrosine phosphorylase [Alphaproteobacteria bacterium]